MSRAARVAATAVVALAAIPAVFLIGWAVEARDRRRNQALLVRKAGR